MPEYTEDERREESAAVIERAEGRPESESGPG
jgi:hypothetical protein